MGILNVTPDSFSDGGRFLQANEAIVAGVQMVSEGATIVDVGGESTRPGHKPIMATEEIRRILPVVEGLVGRGVRVSVDTRHEQTADAVLAAGATYINRITELVDAHGETVAIDPGFGFVDTYEQDLALWASLDELVRGPYPVMVGLSRKRFVGRVSGITDPVARDEASAQLAVAAIAHGTSIVRVHNVALTVEALATFEHARPVTAYVALGSNLGDRRAFLDEAVRRIDALPATDVVAVSDYIETAAQYVTDQPDFLNGAIRVETKLPFFAFFTELQAIEIAMGRVKERDKGPRTIDLDLLRFGEVAYTTDVLTVPHPLMHERDFVLRPLAQITL
jgi:dihydropteroate synthase